MRCRTVDSGVEKLEIAGDNGPQPVGCRWTSSSPACGSRIRPQPVDIFRPRIHKHLTWSDDLAATAPVDTVWTTSRSPGCGRKKVHKSVEGGRNLGGIRTAGVGFGGLKRWPPSAGSAREGLQGAPEGLRRGCGGASERVQDGSEAGRGTAADRLATPAEGASAIPRRPPDRLRHDEGRPGKIPGRPRCRSAGVLALVS